MKLTLGEVVRRTRYQMGDPTQAEFGKLFNVIKGRVGKWETGQARPGPTAMDTLSKMSGVPLKVLQNLPIDRYTGSYPQHGASPRPKLSRGGVVLKGKAAPTRFTRRVTDPNLLQCQQIMAELKSGQGKIMDHIDTVTEILRDVATLMRKAQSLRVTMRQGNHVVTDKGG